MTLKPGLKPYRRTNKPSKVQRRRIFSRDNYTCQICGVSLLKPRVKATIDHIEPADPITGYDNQDSNLRAACFNCNLDRRRERRDARKADWLRNIEV